MIVRIATLISALFLIASCQTTSKMGDSSGGYGAINKYLSQSESLEPFTKIPGDRTGARASDRVFFAFDSSKLTRQAQRTLDRQVGWLKKNSKISVTVEGHCDERGTREYNLALGERRSASVRNYLRSSGISSRRIKTISYGKERPAVVGSNASAWAQNRRGVTTLNR